jgi:glycosyltransferase involved in cell wall biosynthesis
MDVRSNLRQDTVIVTTTWYNWESESNRLRARVALRAVREAVGLGYEIVVVDGGSPKEFVSKLKSLGARVYRQKDKGMGIARREAMRWALKLEGEVMVWMEPEKAPLVSMLQRVVRPILDGEVDLAIAGRKSLGSYPTEQQHGEWLINRYWQLLTGNDWDISFGPRVWKTKFTDYFLSYDGRFGDKWDSIFIPVMEMLEDGRRVEEVEVDYRHPKELVKIEEGDLGFLEKRVEQLSRLVKALKGEWKSMDKRKKFVLRG